jgi:ABC-type ATPase involved in cell division
VEFPVDQLDILSNFKADADSKTGVVRGQQLQGAAEREGVRPVYHRLGFGPIQVWAHTVDGKTVHTVVSGRHRLDLARRAGEKTIPAQVIREADGWTEKKVRALDAELNIKDEKGTVKDYVKFFTNTDKPEAQMRREGLFDREKGKQGWTISKHASQTTLDAFNNGILNPEQAVMIAQNAPGNDALQRVGVKYASEGRSADYAAEMMADARESHGTSEATLDMFVNNDAELQKAEARSKTGLQIKAELKKQFGQLNAFKGAAKEPALARQFGIEATDPAESQKQIEAAKAKIKSDLERWERWRSHPDLVAQVNARMAEGDGKLSSRPITTELRRIRELSARQAKGELNRWEQEELTNLEKKHGQQFMPLFEETRKDDRFSLETQMQRAPEPAVRGEQLALFSRPAEQREAAGRLDEAIEMLPKEFRHAARLFAQGLTPAEVNAQMNKEATRLRREGVGLRDLPAKPRASWLRHTLRDNLRSLGVKGLAADDEGLALLSRPIAAALDVQEGREATVEPKDLAETLRAMRELAGPVNISDRLRVAGVDLGRGLGIPRGDMPQIPAPTKPKFYAELRGRGVSVREGTVLATKLHPAQREMDGGSIGKMIDTLDPALMAGAPILVSRDNRVLDGHHRWVAWVAKFLRGEVGALPVMRIGLDAPAALDAMREFAAREGIAPRAMGAQRTGDKAGALAYNVAGNEDRNRQQSLEDAGGERLPGQGELRQGAGGMVVRGGGQGTRSEDGGGSSRGTRGNSRSLYSRSVDRRGRDARLVKAYGDDWPHGWNDLGLPNPPATLAKNDPLLVPTWTEKGEGKATAMLTAQDKAVKLGLLPAGEHPRAALHKAVRIYFFMGGDGEKRMDELTPPTRQEYPEIMLLGGGSGAGKSTRLKQLIARGEFDPSNRVLINADVARLFLPEYQQIIDRGDWRAATTTHEEVSEIAKAIFAAARAEGLNITFDKTMGKPAKELAQIRELRAEGYHVRMLGVTVDPHEALVRVYGRAAEGDEKGRFVPDNVTLEVHRGFNAGMPAYARELGEGAVFYDTSPEYPIHITSDEAAMINSPARLTTEARARLNPQAKTLDELLASYGQTRTTTNSTPLLSRVVSPVAEPPRAMGAQRTGDKAGALAYKVAGYEDRNRQEAEDDARGGGLSGRQEGFQQGAGGLVDERGTPGAGRVLEEGRRAGAGRATVLRSRRVDARGRDARLVKAYGEDWAHGWNALGLPNLPRTIAEGDPLLAPTATEDGEPTKETAILTEQDRAVRLGLLPAGEHPRADLWVAVIRYLLDGGDGKAHRSELTAPTPQEFPEIMLLGGGSGAGKSTRLRQLTERGEFDPSNRVLINADVIRLFIPEYRQIVERGDGRAAATTHSESSQIAKNLYANAVAKKLNITFDKTMGMPAKELAEIRKLRAEGYHVRLLGVTVDPHEALVRVYWRAAEAGDDKGRFVPDSVTLEVHRGFNAGMPAYARELGEGAVFWDTSPEYPIAITSEEAAELRSPARQTTDARARLDPDATTLDELLASYGETRSNTEPAPLFSRPSPVAEPPRDRPVTLVFGGSFSPFHKEHTNVALDAKKYLEAQGYTVAKVILAPSADKLLAAKLGPELIPVGHRAEMIRRAIAEHPELEVSDEPAAEVEAAPGKIKRTMLADWAEKRAPGTTVINVTGADAAPGNPPGFPSVYQGDPGTSHEGYYYLALPRDEGEGGVSSSKIRRAVKEGRDIGGVMHPEAEAYYRSLLGQREAALFSRRTRNDPNQGGFDFDAPAAAAPLSPVPEIAPKPSASAQITPTAPATGESTLPAPAAITDADARRAMTGGERNRLKAAEALKDQARGLQYAAENLDGPAYMETLRRSTQLFDSAKKIDDEVWAAAYARLEAARPAAENPVTPPTPARSAEPTDLFNENEPSPPATRQRPAAHRRPSARTAPSAGLDDLFGKLAEQREPGGGAGVDQWGEDTLFGASGRAGVGGDSGGRGDAAEGGGLGDGAAAGDGGQRGGADAGGTGLGGRGAADAAGAGATGDVGAGGDGRSGSRSEPALTERPAPGTPERNHVIERGTELSPRGIISKLRANLAAIEILKRVEAEGRAATAAEKAQLVQYSGWGALSQAFDDQKAERVEDGEIETRTATRDRYQEMLTRNPESDFYRSEVEMQEKEIKKLTSWRDKWTEHHQTLRATLTKEEYRRAQRSTINAHYTAPEYISAMWDMARQLGFRGGNVLEPGAGIGHFYGLMPQDMMDRSQLHAVELDDLSGRILRMLYPEVQTQITGFQAADIADNSIDLSMSNVPFADVPVTDANLEAQGGPVDNLHDYFFGKAVTKARPGGLMMFITSAFTMDKLSATNRQWLTERADLVGAFRLPNDAFKANDC